MIFLSLRVTADTEGGLKIRAHLRPDLQGVGAVSHQHARAGYIPAHCLPLLKTSLKRLISSTCAIRFTLAFQQAQKFLGCPRENLIFFPYNTKSRLP